MTQGKRLKSTLQGSRLTRTLSRDFERHKPASPVSFSSLL